MPETPCKFFLTTPIYYVNARPHIGHAYTTIVADVLARRARAQGTPTWFLTGTDEHGQKIERSALAAGIPPQQFADEVSQSFQTLWQRMGITNDQFIRTTDPAHKRGVQKLFSDLYNNKKIYLSSYTGQYSIGEEMFVEGPPGTIGPDGKPTETVTEENFFFRLSDYQLPLLNLIESDTLRITPEARKNEVLSFLRGPVGSATSGAPFFAESHPAKGGVSDEVRPLSSEPLEPVGPNDLGPSPSAEPEPTTSAPTSGLAFSKLGNPYLPGALRDLSVSRSSFTWGIPVPEPAASEAKEKHVIYVWLDALANYMTALGYGSDSPEAQAQFAKFWPADLHLVGKEIIRFHCVYWPAFLLAAGLPLPKAVTAHGWLLFDDSKMSKSKGNIVRTETILSAFGTLCPPPVTPTPHHGVILSAAKNLSSSPEAPPTSPEATTSLPTAPGSLLPAPESPGAPFISQPHREMSGTTEASLTTTGAPSFAESHPAKDGVSDEVRPPSSNPTQNSVILSERSESKDPGSLNPAQTDRPTSTGNALLQGTPSGVPQDALQNEGRVGALAPTRPLLSFRSEAEESASVPGTPTDHQRDLFAADVLRYFLLREIPFGQDGSFTFEALITRYNADLANGYGNLVSRTFKMIEMYCGGLIPEIGLTRWTPFSDPTTVFSWETLYLFDQQAYSSEEGQFLEFDVLDFGRIASILIGGVATCDGALTQTAPWKLAKVPGQERTVTGVLREMAESIRIITALLHPILPYATAAVWRQLGLGDIESAAKSGELMNVKWGGLETGRPLGPLAPIFPRADKGLAQIMANIESEQNNPKSLTDAATPLQSEFAEAPIASASSVAPDQSASSVKSVVGSSSHPAAPPRTADFAESNPGTQVAASAATITERPGTPSHTEAPASGIFASQPADSSPQITIDDFAKVELRVAQVLVCERIPKADKLLRLEVDLGYEKRQILSGIAEWYTPEELIGRRIVVITNLAPRKMRGLESHGMLLAASTEGGKPHLATFSGADDLPLGSRLK